MKIISGILIIIVAVLSFKHGLDGLRNNAPNGDANMFSWGINKPFQTVLNITTILVAVMILFPQTFFAGNVISAMLFILLMGFQLQSGNIKAALIEIPFLFLSLVLIYLGHPFKK